MALVILSLLAALLLLAGCGTQTKKPETVTRTFTAAHFRFSLTYPSSLHVSDQEEGNPDEGWFVLRLQDGPAAEGGDHTLTVVVAGWWLPVEEDMNGVRDRYLARVRRWTLDSAAKYDWVWTYTSRFRFSQVGPYRALVASYDFGEAGNEHEYFGKQYILTDGHRRLVTLELTTQDGEFGRLKELEKAAQTLRILPVPGDSSPAGASQ